jgi:hypothetical protein
MSHNMDIRAKGAKAANNRNRNQQCFVFKIYVKPHVKLHVKLHLRVKQEHAIARHIHTPLVT